MLDFARVAEKRVRETRRDGIEFYNQDQWEKGKSVERLTVTVRIIHDQGAAVVHKSQLVR